MAIGLLVYFYASWNIIPQRPPEQATQKQVVRKPKKGK
jgi:hypothetical protein